MSPYQSHFTYDELPAENATKVRAFASAIRGVLRRGSIEIAQHLADAKQILGHGHFEKWVETELEISPRSASRYLRNAKFLEGKSATVAVLPQRLIDRMASPKADSLTVTAILDAADSGHPLPVVEVENRLDIAAKLANQFVRLTKKNPSFTGEEIKQKQERINKGILSQEKKFKLEEQARIAAMRPLAELVWVALGDNAGKFLAIQDDHYERLDFLRALTAIAGERNSEGCKDNAEVAP